MNATSIPPERPKNPTHFGGEGLYESAGSGAAPPFDAPPSDPSDLSHRADRAGKRPTSALLAAVRRNTVPLVIALGGLIWLVASQRRRKRAAG
jgi:hypothetical protein